MQQNDTVTCEMLRGAGATSMGLLRRVGHVLQTLHNNSKCIFQLQSSNMDSTHMKQRLSKRDVQDIPKAMQLTIDLPTNPGFLEVSSRRHFLLIAPALCPQEYKHKESIHRIDANCNNRPSAFLVAAKRILQMRCGRGFGGCFGTPS